MRAAGAQQMESGIQSGLVSSSRKSIHRQRTAKIITTLDCRNISSKKISENRRNLSRNFAVCLNLQI